MNLINLQVKMACQRLRKASAEAVKVLGEVDAQLKAITPAPGRPRGVK